MTESRINLVWNSSTHCAVLSWVALLIARLLHFINGDRPAGWRVPLFARRCPFDCLGSKDIWVWQWTLKRFDIYISSFISRKTLFKNNKFLFKPLYYQYWTIKKWSLILIKRVIMFENSDCNGYVCFENQNSWENILTIIVKASKLARSSSSFSFLFKILSVVATDPRSSRFITRWFYEFSFERYPREISFVLSDIPRNTHSLL